MGLDEKVIDKQVSEINGFPLPMDHGLCGLKNNWQEVEGRQFQAGVRVSEWTMWKDASCYLFSLQLIHCNPPPQHGCCNSSRLDTGGTVRVLAHACSSPTVGSTVINPSCDKRKGCGECR